MIRWRNMVALTLLSGGVAIAAWSPLPAATSSTSDILSNDRTTDGDTVDLGSVKPIARPNREAPRPAAGGNPLWSRPRSVLTATQERPIFSASRRPPRSAVAAPVMELASAPPPPKPAEPEKPPLSLIGAVVGDSEAIAVFVDRTNQKMVRLRQGESHAGWLLSSVLRREVTLKKADQTETIALKSADVSAAPGMPAMPGVPGMPVPTAIGGGALDTSYAPFVPRMTPKNGESDGL
jgi:general secretion pathway protein N